MAAAAATLADGQFADKALNKLTFEVASVKPNNSSGIPHSNFPLGSSYVYVPNGGFFYATNQPLLIYIYFAYKVVGNQGQFLREQLPDSATTERFDIQARSALRNPTKDQMREMMRSLLADRFKFAVHYETRQVPVFALEPVKSGQFGPQLQPHPANSSCSDAPGAETAKKVVGRFPALCGSVVPMTPTGIGSRRQGARALTMDAIASHLIVMGNLNRPVVDGTGLSGTFDFVLEWAPEPRLLTGVDSQSDLSGPSFEAALREQLGLKLKARKGPVQEIVVDHLERLAAN